jgi:O-antigen/teichoic acid export membrane protein
MPLTTVLTANERFDLSMAVQVIGQLMNLGVGLAFLLLGFGFLGLLYTGFVVMPVQIILSVWAIRRFRLARLPFEISPKTWASFIRASLPFGLTSLALTYNLNADTVILGFFHTQADVGWYQAAYKLVFNITGLLGGFLVVITPSLAREYHHDPERVHSWSRAVVQWMALFALPITIGISILAPTVISLLYGPRFAPSAPALAVICWDVPLVMFNAFCGNLTAATGLERPAARIYLLSTILNIVLNLLLIPSFGFMAAAANTVITDGLTSIRFAILLHEHVQIGRIAPRVGRILLGTLLTGGVVWLARGLPLPLTVLSGGATYGLLAVFLKLGDWDALLRPVRRLLGNFAPATFL